MGGQNFQKIRFLIADDNAHMRKFVTAILQALGATVIFEAPDGEGAWQLFRANKIDVVIIDWQMEGTSGIEIVRRIRSAPDTPDPFVPIVMLTGHSQAERVREARDAGANEFITKPVSVKGLMTKLVSLIENPRPFVRTQTYFGPCRRRHAIAFQGKERRNAQEWQTLSAPPTKEDS